MFEFSDFYQACYIKYSVNSQLYKNTNTTDIVKEIAKLLDTITQERKSIIANDGFVNRILHKFDDVLRTDALEYIDQADFPVSKKLAVMQGLHFKNVLFATYKKIFAEIAASIQQTNQRENRPYRIIEIAGGKGFLSDTIYQLAQKTHLVVDIVCTDIVDDYVQALPSVSDKNGARLQFAQLDAMNMGHIPDQQYDVMLSLHSMHHFSPEQLALILSEAQRVCREGILAVDGTRSAGNQLFIVISAAFATLFQMSYSHLHDAGISARKMYPAQQLYSIAKIACPHAYVAVGKLSLGLNYLKVITNANK